MKTAVVSFIVNVFNVLCISLFKRVIFTAFGGGICSCKVNRCLRLLFHMVNDRDLYAYQLCDSNFHTLETYNRRISFEELDKDIAFYS